MPAPPPTSARLLSSALDAISSEGILAVDIQSELRSAALQSAKASEPAKLVQLLLAPAHPLLAEQDVAQLVHSALDVEPVAASDERLNFWPPCCFLVAHGCQKRSLKCGGCAGRRVATLCEICASTRARAREAAQQV